MPLKRKKIGRLPEDADIENALREAVADAHAEDRLAELTANIARSSAEKKLGLDAGFLKGDSAWKDRSRAIVQSALDDVNNTSPTKSSRASASPPSSPESAARSSKKRANGSSQQRPRKRGKRTESDEESAAESNEEEAKPVGPGMSRADSDSTTLSEPPEQDPGSGSGEEDAIVTTAGKATADSESELSDVIDEPAPKKRRSKDASKKAPKKAAKSKKEGKARSQATAATKDANLSPDEAEIKRLQSWLVKCGMRKMWYKELAPYDSNKAKIKHLKGMLESVGMTGRYSAEKANAIKEQRELAADLAAVQEGNKSWGKKKGGSSAESDGDDDEPEEVSKPAPRPRAASRFIDFGEDEDDE